MGHAGRPSWLAISATPEGVVLHGTPQAEHVQEHLELTVSDFMINAALFNILHVTAGRIS